MQTLGKFIRFIIGIITAILAPFILIVLGALVIGFGAYQQWEWMMYGGMVIAALGVFWIMRYWYGEA